VGIGSNISGARKARLAIISSMNNVNGVLGWAKPQMTRHIIH
jgi:hypothetical protein